MVDEGIGKDHAEGITDFLDAKLHADRTPDGIQLSPSSEKLGTTMKNFDRVRSRYGDTLRELPNPDSYGHVLVSQIEEGFLDAEAGRITPANQARADLQAIKLDWINATPANHRVR